MEGKACIAPPLATSLSVFSVVESNRQTNRVIVTSDNEKGRGGKGREGKGREGRVSNVVESGDSRPM